MIQNQEKHESIAKQIKTNQSFRLHEAKSW